MTARNKYNFAFLDEGSKREIRRAILKAIAIPGCQIPFGSRELPIGRGWGTGGIQITLSIIGPDDVLKVIDQGSDDSVNAVSIKKFVNTCTGAKLTTDSEEATIIQTRHRIPEEKLREGQTLVLQVPNPEPLRFVERSLINARKLHADMDYSAAWLALYEQITLYDKITLGADYPVMTDGRYVMAPSPIPRYDTMALDDADCLYLFGAGREKMIYAVPPHTSVKPLDFEDYPFAVEYVKGRRCRVCGAEGVFFDEIFDSGTGERYFQCSDSGFCKKNADRANGERGVSVAADSEG
ncbi:MAG: alpha-D-ribose 1-methylphosphonate 5-phosphate C-P-lyase PhnJ [Oscillospiraceae bacterium]|jgi:alpha-D-ribose 1-methylphosphonate 5-phosphate C-P lyase|nr:alpha-D-ribose 1-methylphosphonate 5-phosphate C-P-lyase PhnJ [Oscillospiraceae bacterium]